MSYAAKDPEAITTFINTVVSQEKVSINSFYFMRRKMNFREDEKGLTIVASRKDRQELGRLHKEYSDSFHSTNTMIDWLDSFIGSSEFSWSSDEIALCSCPCLVRRDEDDAIIDAFGFMDYCLRSVLQDLQEYGEAFFQRG